jgi:3-oxoadipate enol-lactonase
MPVVNVNRTNIYYEATGAGQPLVFVHGENHGIEMFEQQVAHFSTQYRCLTYFRRGHGRSDPSPYGYSLWNQSLDLHYLLEDLSLGDVVLVAVAMSTPIAVTYALEHPENVRGLVLASWYELDGYPRLEERRRAETPFPELNLQMHEIREREGEAGLRSFMERTAQSEFPILPEEAEQRTMLIRMFVNQPTGRYIHAAEYYSSLPYLVPYVKLIQCPILGVCGKNDPSPDRPELLADVSSFRQEWIPDARRFPSVEQPTMFNLVLESFLKELEIT